MHAHLLTPFLCLAIGFGDTRIIKDLTHTFDENAPKYPLNGFNFSLSYYFKMKQLVAKDFGDFWLAFNFVEFYEHQGTHMDAPSHFGRGRWSNEEIPPERLIGPGVVIDIRDKAATNSDYAVTVSDIEEYERKFGRIPPNAIVMLNSGWGKHYPNSEKVFGTKMLNDTSTFSFPGWSIDACKMLLKDRQLSVLGTDTPSLDPGSLNVYPCHIHLQNSNVPLLEYVANLDTIPQNGTTIVLGNIKVRGGTGGATRIFAILDESDTTSGAGMIEISFLGVVASLLALCWSRIVAM